MNQLTTTALKIDATELAKLGLHGEEIYVIEYDIPRGHNVKGMSKEQSQFLTAMRFKMNKTIKFVLKCMRNLDSSWFLEKEKLEEAELFLTEMRDEYRANGFNMDKRIRILPLITTDEAYESYEDRKAEFLLQWISESMEKVLEGLHDKIMSETTLWRCKKCIETVEITKELLKGNNRYNEILDELNNLDDKIQKYENLKQDLKEQRKLANLHKK